MNPLLNFEFEAIIKLKAIIHVERMNAFREL